MELIREVKGVEEGGRTRRVRWGVAADSSKAPRESRGQHSVYGERE